MTVVERLAKLQQAYFQQSGDLYENVEQLGDVLYKLMLADLIKVYEQESKLLLDEAKIDYASAKYRNACRRDLKTPGHRFLCFGRNEPAALIYREITAEYDEDYDKRVDDIEQRERKLDDEYDERHEREKRRRKAKKQFKNNKLPKPQEPPASEPSQQDKPGATNEPQSPAGTSDNANSDEQPQTSGIATNSTLTAKK